MTYQAATIEGSETRVMQSELTGKDYLISVSLLYGDQGEPEKKWPVVYHMQGNEYFGMITEIVRSMAWCEPAIDAIDLQQNREGGSTIDRLLSTFS